MNTEKATTANVGVDTEKVEPWPVHEKLALAAILLIIVYLVIVR